MNLKDSKKLLWIAPLTLALLLSACGKSDDSSKASDDSKNKTAATTNETKDSNKTDSKNSSTSSSNTDKKDTDKAAAGDMKDYENAANGISIKYPSDWQLQEGASGSLAAFLSPAEGSDDVFQENVSLTVQDLSAQPMNLKQYVELSENQVKNMLKGTLEKNEATKLGDLDAHEFVYSATQNDYNLKFRQVFAVKNNKAYVATYAALEDSYDKFLDKATQTMDSLQIK
ncbi:hypothetical protein DCC85_09635 [Paenibacillus sp. CAA11]|uniref:PsbP-related protein n=1 Tax=Paenibacillus sp. CAA11 TaxID=1532905 RepID=UPI000D3835FF|nr:PsbP-related protein [Paenibacillus sp. CAA11]AWB44460.1 hypothetical protein DCC85_09635 [Paenibacillus sp. CAA11]